MATYINDDAIGEDHTKAAQDDQILAVRFTVEKRLNHALMTRVDETNRAHEERAVLLDHAGKFDEGTAERAKKLPDTPIYRDIEFITIKIPGDKTLDIHRPVMAADKHRFRAKYQAFKDATGEPVEGTPLSVLGEISQGQLADLAYVGIKTIEHMAKVADGNPIMQMMGGSKLKQRAAEWVKKNRVSSQISQTNDALRERDARIDALQAQLTELLAATKAARRWRRRPNKDPLNGCLRHCRRHHQLRSHRVRAGVCR
jgi:hypothetical protein